MRGKSSSVCFVLGHLHIILNRGISSLISRREGAVATSDSFEMEKAARILSVQSHTTHGYVGNKAATFPLQIMGYDVNCINTVSLSNHPAYKGGCKGSSLQLQDLTAFIEGLENNYLLNYNAVITGVAASAEHEDDHVRVLLPFRRRGRVVAQTASRVQIQEAVVLGTRATFR